MLTAEWPHTCTDMDMSFEDDPGGGVLCTDAHYLGANDTAPCGEESVLGTGLDICYCSECVSSAFTADAGVCGVRHKEMVLSDPEAHTALVAAPGVPASPRSTRVQSSKPAWGAREPHRGVAPSPPGCNTGGQQAANISQRRQKNREHAHLSRIRKQKELAAIIQHEAELVAECARLRAILTELEHEQTKLQAELVVDVFLC